jgi:4-hydroxy-tetrahydrodipicolinate reductase
MGQRVVALTIADPELRLAAALESPSSPVLGRDAGELAGAGHSGVSITSELTDRVDVIIDFSTPDGLNSIVALCEERRIPLVVATTGFSPEQRAAVLAASQSTPILRILKNNADGVDVEIIERHHRFKEDAPSGTALQFGRIVAEQMGQTEHIHGRQGRTGRRPHGEIGYHALRTGDNVGEHTIVFGMMGETIDMTVRGHTRDSYAYGALAAAKFLVQKSAGLYSMTDVLNLNG